MFRQLILLTFWTGSSDFQAPLPRYLCAAVVSVPLEGLQVRRRFFSISVRTSRESYQFNFPQIYEGKILIPIVIPESSFGIALSTSKIISKIRLRIAENTSIWFLVSCTPIHVWLLTKERGLANRFRSKENSFQSGSCWRVTLSTSFGSDSQAQEADGAEEPRSEKLILHSMHLLL